MFETRSGRPSSRALERLAKGLGTRAQISYQKHRAFLFAQKAGLVIFRTRGAYRQLARSIGERGRSSQSVETLLDNFYVVEGALTTLSANWKHRVTLRIPQAEDERGEMRPRAYLIARALVKETECQIDKEIIAEFLSAYQKTAPLSLRELDIFPDMLRFALVEKILRFLDANLASLREMSEADRWYATIANAAGRKDASIRLKKLTAALSREYTIIPQVFGLRLFHRLSQAGKESELRTVSKWLKLSLSKQGASATQLSTSAIRAERMEAKAVASAVGSLRYLAQVRWDDVSLELNMVNAALSKDPSDLFTAVTEETRSLYQQTIARIADGTGSHDIEVAREAVRLAREAANNRPTTPERQKHVGYYLADDGVRELERTLGYSPTVPEVLREAITKRSVGVYIGFLCISTLLATMFLLSHSATESLSTPVTIALLLLGIILTSEIATAVGHYLFTRIITPRILPALDLAGGVGASRRTIVVVPSMYRDGTSAAKVLRRVEENFVANDDPDIFFALLMDFQDAPQETMSDDATRVKELTEGIARLNTLHPSSPPRFTLFSRMRTWNPAEGVFMGWERKRGKLREFNLLLRGKQTSYLADAQLAAQRYKTVRYVITLDEDTELVRDSARALIGTIDHPLNRPVIDEERGVVVEGYGIIQPRAALRFRTGNASVFARLFGNFPGIDTYSSLVSDLHQDLFGDAIFHGKGIYDIDTIERTMSQRIPDNVVLSHDLLEGCYARTGIAAGATIFEGFPADYREHMERQHRWIRGDWQVARWLLPAHGGAFSTIARYRIFDNLRRSVLPAAAVLAVLCSAFSPASISTWSVAAALALGSGQLVSAILGITERTVDWRHATGIVARFESVVVGSGLALARTFLLAAFALNGAIIATDAIARSAWRLFISKKKTLEWKTAYDSAAGSRRSVRSFTRFMWRSVCLSLLFLAFEFTGGEIGNLFALTWITLWLAAPALAALISTPRGTLPELSIPEQRYLRKIAARTFWFFLDLANKDSEWLIPDHLQLDPPNKRHSHGLGISPTNLGMYLVALSSGRMLGLSPLSEHCERVAGALYSMRNMELYRGHFYNWYELKMLTPLAPRYVSSVDSANLALSLTAFSGALRETWSSPIIGQTMLDGLEADLAVLLESCDALSSGAVERGERELLAEISGAARESLSLVQNAGGGELTARQCDLVLSGIIHHAVRTRNALETLRLDGKGERFDDLFFVARHVESTAEGYRNDVSRHLSYALVAGTSSVANSRNLHARYLQLSAALKRIPSVNELSSGVLRRSIESIGIEEAIMLSELPPPEKEKAATWYSEVLNRLGESEKSAQETEQTLLDVARSADAYVRNMDFAFLYNRERGLFHIGYNSMNGRLDESFYDLLASEANAASIVGITKRDIPLKHWGYLGRKFVKSSRGDIVVASWAGSLFEYLGTLLYFDTPRESLWGVSAQRAIAAHRAFARRYSIPWGMGESASSRQDADQNYHYQAFGEPSLGYKRDLSESIVVSPYTSALALSLAPKATVANFADITQAGGFGRYGFYDAIDFTGRKSGGNELSGIPARIYYAHHQGFILASIANALAAGWVRTMVAKDPRMGVASQLLEEKMPDGVRWEKIGAIIQQTQSTWRKTKPEEVRRRYVPWRTKEAISLFISSGEFRSRISAVGAGESCFGDVNITRASNDMLREQTGTFFYLYDPVHARVWSPSFMPSKDGGDRHAVSAGDQAVVFEKTTAQFASTLLVTPIPGEEGELRELTVRNTGDGDATLTFGICAELSLSRQTEETTHPNYERLFVATETHWDGQAIVASRHDPNDRNKSIVAGFILVGDKPIEGLRAIREKEIFFGSPQSKEAPPVLRDPGRADTSRPTHTLDSVAAFVGHIRLQAGEARRITLVTFAGRSKDAILLKLRRHRNPKMLRKIATACDHESARLLAELGATSSQAEAYSTLASLALSRAMYSGRPPNTPTPQWVLALWKMSISGARPIILLSVTGVTDLPAVRQILNCHTYFINKGIPVDIVIFNNHSGGYLKTFEDEVDFLLHMHRPQGVHAHSMVFHVRAEHLSDVERAAILSAATIRVDAKKGSLVDAATALRQYKAHVYPPKLVTVASASVISDNEAAVPIDGRNLQQFNGVGGYDSDTKAYVIFRDHSRRPPRPWSTIIANEQIGFLATDRGMSFTWTRNSYDNKLTVPYNDALSDSSGEAFYIRDDETGNYTSPLPLSSGERTAHEIRFGERHATYMTRALGLTIELSMVIAPSDPIKFYRLRLVNDTPRTRALSLFGHFEVLLGSMPPETKKHLAFTLHDGNMLSIAQCYRHQFPDSRAFVGVSGGADEWSTSREEFLGRHGTLSDPAALSRTGLSSEAALNDEPAATLQKHVTLPPKGSADVTFFLGETEHGKLPSLLAKAGSRDVADAILEKAHADRGGMSLPRLELPDPSLTLLANRFLLQQLTASRIHARLGFSQIGGAFGYRDQLQDALAMLWCDTKWVKGHILTAAAHQFREGDALSWWQPHNNFGARTRLSDPQLWLPYVTLRYIRFTGDEAVLEKVIPYLSGEMPDRAERQNVTGVFAPSDERGPLYEHLIRAVERSLTSGPHGLPLIGSADWNDGMNKVGVEGVGESIWLAWLTIIVLDEMSALTDARGDAERAARYRSHAARYRDALKKHGWDGRWYRRAFTDSGALVGTSGAKAFRVDSVAQSWACFANGPTEETLTALRSAKDELAIYEGHVPLAWPPSSRTTLDLGTISDYPPGVRENASQYNHAALWLAQALFASGDPDAGKIILDAVNPMKRSENPEKVAVYQGEPYAVAAEIYSAPTYPGRAGWTWYTASAGIFYCTILEYVLGIKREGKKISFTPSFPSGWSTATATLPYGDTHYRIRFEVVTDTENGTTVLLDGKRVAGNVITLFDDKKTHEVTVRIKKT